MLSMSKKYVVRCDHYDGSEYLFNQYDVFDSLADTQAYFDFCKSMPDYDAKSLLVHPIVLMGDNEIEAVESFGGVDSILVFRHNLIQKDSDAIDGQIIRNVNAQIATPTTYTINITRHLHGYENGQLIDSDSKFVEHLSDMIKVMTWFAKLPEIMTNDWNNIVCENDDDRLSVQASYNNSPIDNMKMTTFFDVIADEGKRPVPLMWEQISSFMHNQSLPL